MQSIKARFFGRQTIIEDIVQGVLAPYQPLDFSLVGPKMIGKSRLLKYLASEEGPLRGPDPFNWRPERFRDGHNVIVGHYDCDWPAAHIHLTEFISQSLRLQLQADKHLGLNWSQIDKAGSPGQQIGQIVHQLNQQQIRLVLILDNFDHVLRSDKVTPDMINELRPLTNELGLVVATEDALHDLNQTLASSPLFNVMHQHFIGLLEPDAAREWLEAYHERTRLADAVREALLEMAGGHPFLLARINDTLVELRPLVSNGGPIAEQQLPLIRLRLAEHGRPLFETIWRKLNDPKGQGQAALPLVRQLIQSSIRINQLPAEQIGTINWLINQAVVTYDKDSYHLFSPLFAKFLCDQLGLDNLAQRGIPSTTPAHPDDFNIFEILTPKEADLLRYFQANSQVVLSLEQLLADVWNQPDASPRRVQEAIRRLRNNLNKQTPPIGVIENERGVGYRYVPNKPSN
jgi:hypothetical protein